MHDVYYYDKDHERCLIHIEPSSGHGWHFTAANGCMGEIGMHAEDAFAMRLKKNMIACFDQGKILAAILAWLFQKTGSDSLCLALDSGFAKSAKAFSLVHEKLSDGRYHCLRSAFCQAPLLWHEAPFRSFAYHKAAPKTHPLRPLKPEGFVYRRFVPELQMELGFRALDLAGDLHRFHHWMNEPRAAIWELQGTLDTHTHYLQALEKDPHTYALIGTFNGEPFGYFEVYWAKENRLGQYCDVDEFDRGWHVLVGETKHLGKDKTLAWGKGITHYLFLDDPRTLSVVGEPKASNTKILRYANAWGYVKEKEFDFPHKRAAFVRCERQHFFSKVFKG